MELKDSGTRREFETGAVRDICEGKGRCDLLPMEVIGRYLEDGIFWSIKAFQDSGNVTHLYKVIGAAAERFWSGDRYAMILDVAKHFEDGARKYGDNNWRKGIPVRCYIDSAVRHYLKHLRGDTDEPHNRAFVWNIMCAIWTCSHHPKLNDYISVDNGVNIDELACKAKGYSNITIRNLFPEIDGDDDTVLKV